MGTHYASQVLEYAVETSPNRLRPIARQIAEQYAETPLDERHAVARRRRKVCVYEAEDGMADLYAHLPAAEAYAIHDRLARLVKLVADGEVRADQVAPGGEPSKANPAANRRRNRDEIRADLLSDLLLNGDTDRVGELNASSVRGQVQVLVPSERLLATPAPPGHVSLTPSLDELFSEIGRPAAPPAPIMNGYGPIDSESARPALQIPRLSGVDLSM